METCANCGRNIGNLEQHFVWQNNIVCFECDARLRKQAAFVKEDNECHDQPTHTGQEIINGTESSGVLSSHSLKDEQANDAVGQHKVSGVIENEPFAGKKISSGRAILYVIAIPASIMLADFICGLFSKKMAEEFSDTFVRCFIYTFTAVQDNLNLGTFL